MSIVETPVDLRVPLSKQLKSLFRSVPYSLKSGIIPIPRPRLVKPFLRWGLSQATFLEWSARLCPHRTAIIDDFGELTYTQLRDQARAMSHTLAAWGIGEGSRVALIARNSRVSPVVLVACNYLGASPLIINPASSAQQASLLLDDYRADALVADREFLPGLSTGQIPVIVGYDDNAEAPENALSYDAAVSRSPSRAVMKWRPTPGPTVTMSSGTTGIPKGVARGAVKTPAVLETILPKIPWRSGMTVQLTASLFHTWGWLNLYLVLATRSTMILRRNFDPVQAAKDIDAYGVNAIVSAAVFLQSLEKEIHGKRPMEFVVSSGNAMLPKLVADLMARFGPVICNFYGSTEHGPIACASGPELAIDPTRAGKAAEGVRLAILRADGSPAPTGEVGRIFAANSESMLGYLSARDRAEVVDGVLSTGDLGHIDADGFLHVHGRADDMVIRGGENVFPREVEAFLIDQDGVEDAFVRGIRQGIQSRIEAFVVPSDTPRGRALTPAAIQELVRANLAEHNVPDAVAILDDLPRNDAGKIVPRDLPRI